MFMITRCFQWIKAGEVKSGIREKCGQRCRLSHLSTRERLVFVRPHPNPLPRGEGEQHCITKKLLRPDCGRRHFFVQPGNRPTICGEPIVRDGRTIPPLPGGEGRGEGEPFSDFSLSLLCASRHSS